MQFGQCRPGSLAAGPAAVSCFVFILRRRVKIEYLWEFSRINLQRQKIRVWRIQIAVSDKATIIIKYETCEKRRAEAVTTPRGGQA